MPQIPIIQARQPLQPSHIQAQDFPIAPPSAFGAGIGRELQQSGEVFQRIQSGYDAAEATRLIGEGKAQLAGALAEAKINISDPDEYAAFTKQKITEVYDNSAASAENVNPRVARAVQAGLADDKANAEIQAKFGHYEKKHERAKVDTDIVFDQMSKAAIAAPDDLTREATFRNFGVFIGTMPLSTAEKGKYIKDFDNKVLTGQAAVEIRTNAPGFIVSADNGKYDRLGADVVLKLRESARTEIMREESRQDRIGKQVKEQAEQGWYSQLGTGQLQDADIDDAIRGNNPYITPQKALEFRRHKEQGTGSGGKDQVQTIMSDYYLSGATLGSIQRTRTALNALRTQLGPNEWINKAGNELQSDQRALENQGLTQEANAIARNNRDIANLQTDLDANRQVLPPAFKSITGNTEQQDRAKVKNIYQKQGKAAAEAFVKSKQAETKNKVDSIPQPQKKVIDLTR